MGDGLLNNASEFPRTIGIDRVTYYPYVSNRHYRIKTVNSFCTFVFTCEPLFRLAYFPGHQTRADTKRGATPGTTRIEKTHMHPSVGKEGPASVCEWN